MAEKAHFVDLGFGAAADGEVGLSALDGAECFADGEVAAGVGTGDGVAGAFELVNDGYVAGEHVGEIFEKPKGGKLGHAVAAPALHVEMIGIVCPSGGAHGGRQLVKLGVDEASADVAAEALAIEVGLLGVCGGLEAGVFEGVVGGDDGELDVAGHDFGGFAVASGYEVADFEGGGFATDLAGEAGGIQGVDAFDADFAGDESLPVGFVADAQWGNDADAGDDHSPHIFTSITESGSRIDSP